MDCSEDINKYYILNMFPYPSGDGLHVGHPLGYVASDIFARYKKMKGYKVINPMGFDSFGLPAEQFAILTGQHPSITTANNVEHYIEQMKNIDLDFDWNRKFNTSDPEYYKWTQWIFIKMFNSFYCKLDNKAHYIEDLYKYFEKNGTKNIENYAFFKNLKYKFTADQWNCFSNEKKYKISLDYRIAYLDDIEVNWCEGLKTVLANDEVKNGVSERGGYPVVKKKMKQWILRITAFADRLIDDLDYYYERNNQINNIVETFNSPLKPELEIEDRNIILAIIKHWKEDKYLVIKYKKDDSKAFLTGGIDDNEDIKNALLREIKEETGFINIRKIEKICNTQCTFYHNRKNKNLRELSHNYYVELDNDENIGISKEEQDILDFEWIDEDNLESMITYEEHFFVFRFYKLSKNIDCKYVEKCFDLGLKEGLPILKSNIILVVIKHWSENKYLILRYPKDNSTGFLTGKIEDGECPLEALIREIREETGFINIKKVELICKTKCLVYVHRKDVNAESVTMNYYVELKDDSQVQVTDEEKNKQTYFFVNDEEVKNYLEDKDFIYIFDRIKKYLKKDVINWPESTKEMQKNWIGRSYGANINFKVLKNDKFTDDYDITIFTSRPETIFGVTFLGLSKDHDFVKKYCNNLNLNNIREESEIKTGINTGFFAVNPINNEKIPIWIANYILGDYGTGAIMGVPQLDDRDGDFAEKYGIEVKYIFEDDHFINSEFLNGLDVIEARKEILDNKNCSSFNTYLESSQLVNEEIKSDSSFEKKLVTSKVTAGSAFENELVTSKVTYRLRDSIFSRQRYWGEPIPIFYKEVNIDGNIEKLPFTVDEEDLPLKLPDIDDYKPTGEAPLKKAKDWNYKGYELEVNTMPGWAGSSWYFLRYLDPNNNNEFCSKEKLDEYNNVDLYLGGSEHAVGHLLYSRFFTKFLYDLGYVNFEEPFKKLIHQGMILGESAIIYRNNNNEFISSDLAFNYENLTPIHINVNFVDGDNNVDVEKLKNWRPDFLNSNFIFNRDKKFYCDRIVEKMSKSKYNVINPDDIIEKYGSDVLRMYLMFLGPIEQQKPWNTKGIEGIARFLNKINNIVNKVIDKEPQGNELKIINKCIKNVDEYIENYSFNTAISSMMICLNDLTELDHISKDVFKDFLLILKPFAPNTVKNIWNQTFKDIDIDTLKFPEYNEEYLKEDNIQYPVMINGKTRVQIIVNKNASEDEIKNIVFNNEIVRKWVDNKEIKKFIIVNGKIISIVI